MEKLKGLIAIMDPTLTEIQEVRDYGESYVEVSERGWPVQVVRPTLGENEQYTTYTDVVGQGTVIRTYSVGTIPKEVPYMISRKQFYMELAISGLILKTEATSALTVGILPASLQSIVDGMSNTDAQWEAQCQLLGANDFYRDSPWVLVVATVLGWTDDQVDEFWIRAEKH